MQQMGTQPSPQASRPVTVLLVEDDRAAQEVLQRWLSESGRNAVACSTYKEATEYLASHTPDVLVTDIRLEDYNGLQLVMLFTNRQPGASCLVLSGFDDPVLRREAEQMHAHYLVKPVGRRDFLAAIENLATAP